MECLTIDALRAELQLFAVNTLPAVIQEALQESLRHRPSMFGGKRCKRLAVCGDSKLLTKGFKRCTIRYSDSPVTPTEDDIGARRDLPPETPASAAGDNVYRENGLAGLPVPADRGRRDGFARISEDLDFISEASSLLDPTVDSEREYRPQHHGTVRRVRHRMRVAVEGSTFNFISCAFVVLNAAVIGVQADYEARHVQHPDAANIFHCISTFFCLAFTAEISMRAVSFGSRFFRTKEWQWNIFDSLLVMTQWLDLFAHLLFARGNPSHTAPSYLRLFRLLRLVRIARLVRVLRFLEELHSLAASIVGSMKSLFWTMVLLMILIYSVGICVTQVVTERRALPDAEFAAPELEYYFGSLLRTMLSLFESITGGQSWDLMVQPLIVEISPALAPVFGFYISFCIFALMNSVTGVFCEKAMQNVKADEEAFLINRLKEALSKAAKHHAGNITLDQFKAHATSDEFVEYFKAINVDAQHVEDIFRLLDVDNTGSVEYNELVNQCLRLKGPATSIDLTMLIHETHRMNTWTRSHIDSLLSSIGALSGQMARMQALVENDEADCESGGDGPETGTEYHNGGLQSPGVSPCAHDGVD